MAQASHILTDHQRSILGAVLNSPGIRRSELSELIGISAQTTMRAVKPMVERRILAEQQKPSGKRGKPASVLQYARGSLLTMGISLAVDRVRVHVCDLSGERIASAKVAKAYTNSRQQLADVDAKCDAVLAKIPDCAKLVGVGVSVQGYFLNEGTRFAAKADPQGWAATDLRKHLSDKLGVPVRLMNDGRTLAASLLTTTDSTHFLCIHIGSGIGGGVVMNATLLEGVHGNAGEFGQLFPKDDDRPTEPHFLKAAGLSEWQDWKGVDEAAVRNAPEFNTFLNQAAKKIGRAIETALALLDFSEVYVCSRMPPDLLQEICNRMEIAPLGSDIAGGDSRLFNAPPIVRPHHVPNHAQLACRMALEAYLSPVGNEN